MPDQAIGCGLPCGAVSSIQRQNPIFRRTQFFRPARLVSLAIAIGFAAPFALLAQEDPLNNVHVNPPAPPPPPPGSTLLHSLRPPRARALCERGPVKESAST